MSTYTDASLIYYPSGYKAGTAYSLKPTDGSGDLTFTRASTATRVNESGLIESVATGVPRIDYTGGGCGKLLLEPQRTNLALRSEEFDNASWSKSSSTITANTAISPDGTQNADAIVDTATNAEHNINQTITITSGVASTFSVYLKSGTQPFAMLRHYGAASERYFCVVVNLNTGVITKTQAGTSTSATSSSITNFGNGWYRVTATCVFDSATTVIPILQLANSATPTIGSFGNNAYVGNGTNSVLAWGAQLELGSYPTSIIHTTSTAVTRTQDDARKNGISSLIGQTEGVFYFEFDYKKNQINTALFQTSLGTTNAIYVLCLSDFKLRFIINLGGASQVSITTATVPNLGLNKLAVAYKLNDAAFYLNGTQIGVDNSCSIPGVDSIYLTTANQNTQAFMTFPTRLSNAELETLTTL